MTKHRMGGLLATILILTLIPALALADEAKSFGEGVTLEESTPVSTILASPDDYVGKTVRIEGRIVGVCKKRGCWMELAGDEEFQSMRIKVEDGVIVFPYESKGMYAIAEGEFVAIDLTMEQTCKLAEAECKEHGKEFDKSKVTEPTTIYQVKGTGATIEDRPAEEPAKVPAEAEAEHS